VARADKVEVGTTDRARSHRVLYPCSTAADTPRKVKPKSTGCSTLLAADGARELVDLLGLSYAEM
jgi:hypothetical protein